MASKPLKAIAAKIIHPWEVPIVGGTIVLPAGAMVSITKIDSGSAEVTYTLLINTTFEDLISHTNAVLD